jgi:hydroxymethylbilane synthase
MLPAAGQGALGIEIRSDRADVAGALQHLVHIPTWLAVSAERAVSRMMGGSCSMPLAAYAQFDGEQLRIRAAWGDADGVQPVVYAHASGRVADTASAIALGEQVALALQEGVRAQTA